MSRQHTNCSGQSRCCPCAKTPFWGAKPTKCGQITSGKSCRSPLGERRGDVPAVKTQLTLSSVEKAAPCGWQGMDSGFASWNEAVLGQLARLSSTWLRPSSWPWPKFPGIVLTVLKGELLQGRAWALARLDLQRWLPVSPGNVGGCGCVKGSWEPRKAHQDRLWAVL